jgi:hypothetical protein
MDILIRIKRLVITRRVAFTRKADDEMAIDGLTRELIYEAILNAPTINKKLRSRDPVSGQPETLYVIKDFTYGGVLCPYLIETINGLSICLPGIKVPRQCIGGMSCQQP